MTKLSRVTLSNKKAITVASARSNSGLTNALNASKLLATLSTSQTESIKTRKKP